MIKLLLILHQVLSLKTVIQINPDTVGSESTLNLAITLEQSLGRGGYIELEATGHRTSDSEGKGLRL